MRHLPLIKKSGANQKFLVETGEGRTPRPEEPLGETFYKLSWLCVFIPKRNRDSIGFRGPSRNLLGHCYRRYSDSALNCVAHSFPSGERPVNVAATRLLKPVVFCRLLFLPPFYEVWWRLGLLFRQDVPCRSHTSPSYVSTIFYHKVKVTG